MKNNSIYKKIACALVLANIITMLGVTGCDTNEDPINTGATGTPESTEAPFTSTDELFGAGDKDYFIPFQNPETSYCSISDGLAVPVRQQGMGGCYCYSAVSSMQVKYLKEHGELPDLNPNDIIYRIYGVTETSEDGVPQYPEEKFYISSGLETDLGGDVMMVAGALCADPLNGYVIKEANIYGSYNTDDADFDKVTEEDIKNAVRENGGVCMCVNYKKDCKYINGYYTQNHPENSEDSDHVALVVGWDDDFPADCFATPASRNGAWLVQNSFGINWGNCGYYFVSYDQAIRGMFGLEASDEYSSAIAYGRFALATLSAPENAEKLEGATNISDLSQEEVLSWADIEAASIYRQEGSVAAIGFWTVIQDQPYTIELRDGEFGEVLATKSGSFEATGYHTVKLDTPVDVTTFTVVVKTKGLGSFEGPSRESTASTAYASNYPAHFQGMTEPGRSFIQISGEWVDVTDEEILTKMCLEKIDEDTNTIGDPCITVLFE